MSQTFLDLESEFQVWSQFLEEAAGELTPELESLRAELEIQTTAKLERAAHVRVQLLAHQAECEKLAEVYSEKAKRWAAKVERLEALMQPAVERLAPPDPKGRIRVETPTHLLWVQPHTSERVKELPTFDLGQVPEAFVRRPTPELNKLAAKAALKAGQTIPGLVLEQEVSFSLRVR